MDIIKTELGFILMEKVSIKKIPRFYNLYLFLFIFGFKENLIEFFGQILLRAIDNSYSLPPFLPSSLYIATTFNVMQL